MHCPHNRYFIELQPRDGAHIPRSIEAETRRETAHGVIAMMRRWLKERNLGEKVSALGVTALGQVQITCEAAVIQQIRHEETIDIATIRQGALHKEMPARWNEAH